MNYSELTRCSPITSLHTAFMAACPTITSRPGTNASHIVNMLISRGIMTVGDFQDATLAHLSAIPTIGISASVRWTMVKTVHQDLAQITLPTGSPTEESAPLVTDIMHLHATDPLDVLKPVIKKVWNSTRLYYLLRRCTHNCIVGELFELNRDDMKRAYGFGKKMLDHFDQLMQCIVLIDDDVQK